MQMRWRADASEIAPGIVHYRSILLPAECHDIVKKKKRAQKSIDAVAKEFGLKPYSSKILC